MKAYTDIEQSKKLAEILPLESADMHYATWTILDGEFIVSPNQGSTIEDLQEDYGEQIIPAWSLAALFKMLPYSARLERGSSTELYYVTLPNELESSNWYIEPVDAVFEMILKLYELKML